MEASETTQNKFTEDEQQLAKRYQVEPKLCRLISEIVSEQAEERISQVIRSIQGKKPEAVPAERPEPEEKQLSAGTTAENMVEAWLRKQDYSAKLAIVIFVEYMCGDHGTEELIQRIENEYKAEILRMASSPDESLTSEEIFLTGVCAELFVWSKNL